MTPSADPSLFDRLCDIIEGQNVSEWQGGIHPEDVGHLASALIRAGVTMPVEDCKDGCMWRIPNRVEDMTPRQRELLRRDE